MGFPRPRRLARLLPHALAGAALALAAVGFAETRRRRRRARGESGSAAPGGASSSGASDCCCDIADGGGAAGSKGAAAGGAAAWWPGGLVAGLLGSGAAGTAAGARARNDHGAGHGAVTVTGGQQLLEKLRALWLVCGGAAAQAEKGDPPREVDTELLRAISGEWAKDFSRCEPMDAFFDLFGVGRVLRSGARLMRGMRIELREGGPGAAGGGEGGGVLVVTQVCALRWLSAVEEFPLAAGAALPARRRDLRRGGQRGALAGAGGDTVRLEVTWGPPLEGAAVDEIRLVRVPPRGGRRRPQAQRGGEQAPQQQPEQQQQQQQQQQRTEQQQGGEEGELELHVTSTAWVGGDKARFKWVCVRKEHA